MNQELIQKIKNTPNLPSMPAIAMQVLDLTQRADVDIAEIARIISKDPALSGKILKTVNSSFYGRSQNVSTISHALVILGLQSVKTLVLGFSLVSNLSKTRSKGFNHVNYWKRSIFAATAARNVASKMNIVQQEEAFLAALLADIGMLVLDLVVGEQYGELYSKAASHGDLARLEMETLGMTHADVGGLLAEQWKLPPLLTVPISKHHSSETITDPMLRKLTELVAFAGRCADIFVEEEPASAIADVRKICLEQCSINEAACDSLMADIGKRTKEAATLFEINIGSTQEYEAILKRANETLVEITLQSQMQATELKQQNQELKHAASTDGLTGLANRASFDQFISEKFAGAVKKKEPISLLMIDLDKFKSINDKHGHPAGDAVLKTIGALLASAAREQDLAVRYGGEELSLVLPGTPRAVAAAVAESIRRAVAAKPVTHAGKTIPVTASIGVATFEPGGPFRAAAHLIKAADLAVYNAKHSGRNCVKVFSLKPAAAPAAA